MAKMVPHNLPFDAPPAGRRVFEILRDSPTSDRWTVVWSYRPAQLDLETRRRREIDFLVLIPGAGIICLEAKGGQFDISDGSWYRLGERVPIESPVRQSEQAMFALRNDLIREFQREAGVMSGPLEFAVAFLDWAWPHDIRRPGTPLFDKADFDVPDLFVRNLSAAARQLEKPVDPQRSRVMRLNDVTIARLIKYLAPNYTLAAGPQLDTINQQLVRLTQEQFVVLDMFAGNERCLVKGQAGTGKTMLALEYAKRAGIADANVGLLCFNLLLGNFLGGQAAEYPGITAGGFWPHIMRPAILRSSIADQFLTDQASAGNEAQLYGEIYPHYARLACRRSAPCLTFSWSMRQLICALRRIWN